jgi:ribosomal protein L17
MGRGFANSNAGSIDMSGIAGLGDAAARTFDDILAQGRYDREAVFRNRALAAENANAAAQREVQRQIADQQAQSAEQQRNAQRQGRLLELAQIVPDGDTFMKLAPIMAPDLSPAEAQGYAAFADVTSQRKKEAEKAAKEEKEQAMLRGFVPGMMGGLANLPPDVQQRAIAGLGEQAGLPQEVLGLTVLSEKARQAEADAKEAAANARADIRAGATRDNAAATREATQANRDITHTTQLRKEFNGLSKDFLKQKDGYTRVLSSAKNPTAAGDLALIFNYMKVLDPNSVVRESEFATAAAAGSYGDRVAGYVKRIQNGQRLSDAQRADFIDRSNKLFHDAARNQRKLERRYRKLGKQAGLDPSQTATDFIGKLYKTSGVDIVPAPPTSEPGASFVEMKNGAPVFQRPDGSFFSVTGP